MGHKHGKSLGCDNCKSKYRGAALANNGYIYSMPCSAKHVLKIQTIDHNIIYQKVQENIKTIKDNEKANYDNMAKLLRDMDNMKVDMQGIIHNQTTINNLIDSIQHEADSLKDTKHETLQMSAKLENFLVIAGNSTKALEEVTNDQKNMKENIKMLKDNKKVDQNNTAKVFIRHG